MTDNPFAALASLRDSLPEGEQTPMAGNDDTPGKPGALTFTLFYERKGRGGKEATIIECPDSMTDDEVGALAADLKRAIATGGSTRGTEILLQGDRRKQARTFLTARGHRVKG